MSYRDRMRKPANPSTLDYRNSGMTILEELTARNMAAILAGYSADPQINLPTLHMDALAKIARDGAVATVKLLEEMK